MKRILAIAFAVVAVTIMTDSSANAQINTPGFGFGVGLNQALGANRVGAATSSRNRGFGFLGPFNSVRRFEQPPHFARFPPVYYSHIVRRPYGISPYAAPAGIAPVELSIPAPKTVKNEFFNSKIAPVSEKQEVKKPMDDAGNKTTTTWSANPFVETLAGN